jgi:hypothetical protein
VHEEIKSMKERDYEIRRANGATTVAGPRALSDLHRPDTLNSRMLWSAVLCIIVLLAMGVGQVAYLKNFLKKKKVID